ncbi:hypothetical protein WMF37_13395 [Sorangium sp. So ce291]|uniref:DUF6968 family protein n=1 Tax=Sorangium sp. So ce291 TaxID=3133294 RepID=UPI003F5EA136
MTGPIAERNITLTLPSGIQESIRVRVWAPEYRPAVLCWEADVEVTGAGDTDKSHGAGIDAFQALYGALYLIPTMLSKYEDIGRLSWIEEAWIGFPEINISVP